MKGAIFDVDGTLLDSMGVWDKITRDFFDKYNVSYDGGLLAEFKEMTLQESSIYMKENCGMAQSVGEIKDELNRMAAHEYMYNIPMKPYAKEYVTKLYTSGVKLAIATSGFKELSMAALERCGVWQMFSAIALSNEVGVNKSNPDVYLLAAQRIGTEPRECTVYEDILSGINGAKKADMRAVGIYDEASAGDMDKIKGSADKYIMSWQELL